MANKKRTRPADIERFDTVRKLHDGGLSFAAIGKELGFSKQRVHQIYHQEPPKQNTVKSVVRQGKRLSRGLTVRQRRFVTGLLEGKSQQQAALDAVEPGQITPASASVWAHKTLRDSRVLSAFQELLVKHGLTEERLIQTHVENLHATKVVATAIKNGEVTDVVEAPDYRVRQAAVRDGLRLWDRLEKKGNEEPTPPRLVMYVSLTRAEWIMKVSGKPVHELFKGVRILNDDEDYPTNGTRPPAPIEIEPAAPSPEPKPLAPSVDRTSPSTADDVEWEDDEDIAIDL